eukprot:gnl/MRDRNA2_/MRDRNA2_30609_c0_seq1.p1 gnl/MRDRNA2_/MRDRNA2_30609_c0~~gnl/MRDRNA2_/MRDRNA2_30609_c0_seq1.p1  ORF type:complete len:173 (+),score=36.22 gnl/MRDRNA2_/MRDRNA2_30609_c0_seq1:115-633(+)
MIAYLLVIFGSHLCIAAEMVGETCGGDELQDSSGDILLQSRQSSAGSVSTKIAKDAPVGYQIPVVGVDQQAASFSQTRQTSDSNRKTQNSIEPPVEPKDENSQNSSPNQDGFPGAVLAETETSGLTAEVVFAVSATMTLMISTMLIRTESAMHPPVKAKSVGKLLMEAECCK